MKWQKRARFGVAAFGIASAVVVYATMGQRAQRTVAPPPQRTDPNAVIESSGNVLQQLRGAKQDYLIEAERQLTYQGGAVKMVGVKITVRNRGGRDYVISGREAQAGEDQKELQLNGGVKLAASDGFVVETDTATFNQDNGLMTAPGAVRFGRDRMSGSGVGMSYDKNTDVLTLASASQVLLRDERGDVTMEFVSGRSVFARVEHTLTLDGNVHALRDTQIIDAAQGVARLTSDEQHITDIELRGNSQVRGGDTGIESMMSRDIDLHYSADGETLDRVVLLGAASVELHQRDAAPGRKLFGDALDVTLASDGSPTKVAGRDNVRMELPQAADAPARRITARVLDASGAPGQGLTTATFTDNVEYREDIGKQGMPRLATSRGLTVNLSDDTVTDAAFAGGVKFQEEDLRAASGEARYDPGAGTLRLTGTEGGAVPRVSDERVTIDAAAIDVALQGHLMKAAGAVRTALRPQEAARTGRGPSPNSAARLPSLLKQDQAANVTSETLDYQGASGQAIYTGNATLWQGETAIRASAISIDQGKGDLVATGNARSTIVLDTGVSVAQAAEIRYADAARTITYAGMKGSAPTAAAQAQVSGPQGDLRGDRVEVILGEQSGHVNRLEAYTNVSIRVDTRTATGDRLTYFADDERYVMSGGGTRPVKVVEACKETTGKTLTFFKSTDRIIVDGNEEIRTQTKNGTSAGCAAAPRSR